MVCIKELREEAWAIQNRLSGRAGISGNTVDLPEDVKNGMFRLCSEQLQLCADAEKCYISPEDFTAKARKMSDKLKQLSAHMDSIPAAPVKPMKRSPVPEPAEVAVQESNGSTGCLDEAIARINCRLDSLDLSKLQLTDADLAEVIEAMRATSQGTLKTLNLASNDIRDVGAQRLAAFLATGCSQLTTVDLSHNAIGDAGKAALTLGLAVIRKQLVIII